MPMPETIPPDMIVRCRKCQAQVPARYMKEHLRERCLPQRPDPVSPGIVGRLLRGET